mmetsp:Transcript_24963/g.57348  ORF Transcript_24963/g.57348 Transcript_24963/m.57348 type:complete len:572 (+) Transcript_24963:3-1718(+)
MSGPQVSWKGETSAIEPAINNGMVAPVQGGDGSIFISLASYRDGERCGETLKSIFEMAKNPEKVFVSLVEQNTAQDALCVEEYCKTFGSKVIARARVREGVTKILRSMDEAEDAKCPHLDQINVVAIHHFAAKGPIYARSLHRKTLGNQEFCLQLDAHSQLSQNWDEGLIQEFQTTHNEFAVLSTVPPNVADKDNMQPGGSQQTKVPRQCSVTVQDNGIPDFDYLDAKKEKSNAYALDLNEPLLSRAWSAGFSFSKCHLEEAVPYDPFLYFAKPIEQYGRFARMWTRGYDVYTPTRNFVFHNYGKQENGHGDNEWFQRQKQRFRVMAINRVKLLLELDLSEETDTVETDRANMGIYGLGQRRTLAQFQEFSSVKLDGTASVEEPIKCVGQVMVAYDDSISPLANLHHDDGNILTNLDLSPIFPRRTKPTFATQNLRNSQAVGDKSLDAENVEIMVNQEGDEDGDDEADGTTHDSAHAGKISPFGANLFPHVGVRRIGGNNAIHAGVGPELLDQQASNLPPSSVLLVLWMFGLLMWCFAFVSHNGGDAHERPKKSVKKKTKKARKTKIVKDV